MASKLAPFHQIQTRPVEVFCVLNVKKVIRGDLALVTEELKTLEKQRRILADTFKIGLCLQWSGEGGV